MSSTKFLQLLWTTLSFVILGALVFVGCGEKNNMATAPDANSLPNPGENALTTETIFSTPLGDWTLTAFDPSYDPVGDSTTFSYRLVGPDENMHFVLGYPGETCVSLVAYDPPDGNLNWSDFPIQPNVSWHPPVGSGGTNTFYFSYSFSGDVPSADVGTGIKVNGVNYYEGHAIQGPGIPTFFISGTTFQDADASGSLELDESYITDVTINLSQSGLILASQVTDANGFYEFEVECNDDYTVEIDTSSLTGTGKTYFIPTTATSFDVSVGPDSRGNDFGFDVDNQKLVDDIEGGTLESTGLTSGAWKKEYQFGAAGRTSFFTPEELIGFLNTVETLALETPFVFVGTDEERLNAAYQILRKPIRTDLEALERELLALELNYAAELGIESSTQLVLIGWGESIYNDELVGANPKLGATDGERARDATEVFEGINGDKSPGGGGTR